MLKTGCQWRMLPKDFPKWQLVYYYFNKWKLEGVIEEIHKTIHNLTQNWIHKGFGKQNYYMSYDDFNKGWFSYTGYNNPLSLWNH